MRLPSGLLLEEKVSHAEAVLASLSVKTTVQIPFLKCPECKREFALTEMKREENQYVHLHTFPTFCPFCGESRKRGDTEK